jgi:hypothetical protein
MELIHHRYNGVSWQVHNENFVGCFGGDYFQFSDCVLVSHDSFSPHARAVGQNLEYIVLPLHAEQYHKSGLLNSN